MRKLKMLLALCLLSSSLLMTCGRGSDKTEELSDSNKRETSIPLQGDAPLEPKSEEVPLENIGDSLQKTISTIPEDKIISAEHVSAKALPEEGFDLSGEVTESSRLNAQRSKLRGDNNALTTLRRRGDSLRIAFDTKVSRRSALGDKPTRSDASQKPILRRQTLAIHRPPTRPTRDVDVVNESAKNTSDSASRDFPLPEIDLGGELTESSSLLSQSSQVINEDAMSKLLKIPRPSVAYHRTMAGAPPPPEVTPYYKLSLFEYLEDLFLFDNYNQQEAYLLPPPNLDSFFVNDDSKTAAVIARDKERAYPQVRPYYFLDGKENLNYNNPSYQAVDTLIIHVSKKEDKRLIPLANLYRKSLLFLSDARFHLKPLLAEDTRHLNYSFRNQTPTDQYFEILFEKANEYISEERRKEAIIIEVDEVNRDTYIYYDPAYLEERAFEAEEIDQIYPNLQKEPLEKETLDLIIAERDNCYNQAQHFLKKRDEIYAELQELKTIFTPQEFDYFSEGLKNLAYISNTWATCARQLTELIDLPTEQKTYSLLPLVSYAINERGNLLSSNPHDSKASASLKELRTTYYQQVREAEAAFDRKQNGQ